MKKNKITVRLDDDVFLFLQTRAIATNQSTTKVAEQIITTAAKIDSKTVDNCLLEITVNSAAATLELARIIMPDTGQYDQYQQVVLERTKRALKKYKNQIYGS